jgi:hypothetical protein
MHPGGRESQQSNHLGQSGHFGMVAGGKIVAAAVASSPFDLGAAWKRLAAASIFSLYFWTQYIIVIRSACMAACMPPALLYWSPE